VGRRSDTANRLDRARDERAVPGRLHAADAAGVGEAALALTVTSRPPPCRARCEGGGESPSRCRRCARAFTDVPAPEPAGHRDPAAGRARRLDGERVVRASWLGPSALPLGLPAWPMRRSPGAACSTTTALHRAGQLRAVRSARRRSACRCQQPHGSAGAMAVTVALPSSTRRAHARAAAGPWLLPAVAMLPIFGPRWCRPSRSSTPSATTGNRHPPDRAQIGI